MKEGGTGLHKAIREINLVYKTGSKDLFHVMSLMRGK